MEAIRHKAELRQDNEERLLFENADYYVPREAMRFMVDKPEHISTYVLEPTEVVGLIETSSKWRVVFALGGGLYEVQFFDTEAEAMAALAGKAEGATEGESRDRLPSDGRQPRLDVG